MKPPARPSGLEIPNDGERLWQRSGAEEIARGISQPHGNRAGRFWFFDSRFSRSFLHNFRAARR